MAKNTKPPQKIRLYKTTRDTIQSFLGRREHRSFRLSRKRDYKVETPLPGYVRSTLVAHQTIWKNKRVFIPLAFIYVVLSIALVGMFSQETYNALSGELSSIANDYSVGGGGTLEGAWTMLNTIVTGGVSEQLSVSQQTYSVLLGLLLWLSTIWALRNIKKGNTIRARDALYNSGSPIISTFMLLVVAFLQILPFTIVLLAYSAASSSGFLELPISIVLAWLTVGLSAVLTLYWLTSTLMAFVIVSLPGMYPWASIRAASDLVLGRRLIITYRLIWMIICLVAVWVFIMLVAILAVNWLTSIWGWVASVPVVPVLMVVMSTLTMIYGATYIYMLYRGIVDGLESA